MWLNPVLLWDVCLKSAPSARYPCLASDEAEQNNNLDILKYKHPLISTNPIIKRDKEGNVCDLKDMSCNDGLLIHVIWARIGRSDYWQSDPTHRNCSVTDPTCYKDVDEPVGACESLPSCSLYTCSNVTTQPIPCTGKYSTNFLRINYTCVEIYCQWGFRRNTPPASSRFSYRWKADKSQEFVSQLSSVQQNLDVIVDSIMTSRDHNDIHAGPVHHNLICSNSCNDVSSKNDVKLFSFAVTLTRANASPVLAAATDYMEPRLVLLKNLGILILECVPLQIQTSLLQITASKLRWHVDPSSMTPFDQLQ
ncbi:hypothetical protein LSH36_1244g00013 [Paralvinella palmiformis]|uniref:SUEL-type lectin domain-containing protein n=1 Tax=Paralvinella palmiformis TaxID=53620 RepID=A0AAD9IVE9_9ANNE|nr:hypothetical protein LSH36_1244g00013 [Paralvinella palmiformis]